MVKSTFMQAGDVTFVHVNKDGTGSVDCSSFEDRRRIINAYDGSALLWSVIHLVAVRSAAPLRSITCTYLPGCTRQCCLSCADLHGSTDTLHCTRTHSWPALRPCHLLVQPALCHVRI